DERLVDQLDDLVRQSVAVVLAILDLVDDRTPVGVVLEQVEQQLRGRDQVGGRLIEQHVELAVLRSQAQLRHRPRKPTPAAGRPQRSRPNAAPYSRSDAVDHRLTATPIVHRAGAAAATRPRRFVLTSWWPWAARQRGPSPSRSVTAGGGWASSTTTVE